MNQGSKNASRHSRRAQGMCLLLAWLLMAPGGSLSSAFPSGFPDMSLARTGRDAGFDSRISERAAMESPGAAPKAPAAAHGAERPLSCSPLGSEIAYQPHEDDPSAHEAREQSEKWGDITVAAPKIWQYERVNTYLDGLLRDVEAVSLADLTQLDPNAQNAGAIKFIQSALEIGVQYNQAVGANNALALEAWKAQTQLQLQQIQTNSANLQALQASRTSVIQQLAQAQASLNNLQAIPAGGTALTQGQSAQVSALQTQISNLNSELASLNTAIQSASAMPTLPPPPTLAVPTISGPASGTNVSSTFSGLGEYLSKLPSGIQSELTAALQAPNYPATKRMDSFMTLLYERMAREISALQDDLMRDPNTVAYLVQFDVGLHPASRTKNHIARVEFRLDDSSCPGCKVYSIYPGQSSYNVRHLVQGLARMLRRSASRDAVIPLHQAIV